MEIPVEALGPGHDVGSGGGGGGGGFVKGEVDTSAPFESVKDAVTRFGGIGFWKPHSHLPHDAPQNEEVFDAERFEEQAARLENDLRVKERETLEVLKELEATKTTVEELKDKLAKETAAAAAAAAALSPTKQNDKNAPASYPVSSVECERKQNDENAPVVPAAKRNDENAPPQAPDFILTELNRAKMNLTRTTNDLADIRAAVETYRRRVEKERSSLERTRQRLSSNSPRISSLEDEIRQTQRQIEAAKVSGDPFDLPRELHRLASETEQFKKVGEAAKSEVLRTVNGIEHSKMQIKTAEIRIIAARKLKEAAKAAEFLALSEIEAMSKSETGPHEDHRVTLSLDEYTALTAKARAADDAAKTRVGEAAVEVDEAEVSRAAVLRRVAEATEEVKSSKRALEAALGRAEAANDEKLRVEEGLRRWRSDHHGCGGGQRRKSKAAVQNSTKFKTSASPSPHLRGQGHMGYGPVLVGDGPGPVLRPTMSIGQILSGKLLLTEECSDKSCSTKRKVSLAQMLSRPGGGGGGGGVERRSSGKRKKFGLGRISLLPSKRSKKKKKHGGSVNLSSAAD